MTVGRKPRPTATADSIEGQDRALWEALRECRRRIAAEHGVPPYVIFHDTTLLQMVEAKPRSDQELLALSGVGTVKLEKYGAEFLRAVQHYIDAE
jgi:ATP-dependent DNA helicase RecQ